MNDLYIFTVPVFKKTLGGLRNVLDKAEEFAKAEGESEAAFLERRLWPDMFPFKKQVQVACDNAKLGAMRLSGMEAPKHDDSEASFADLKKRVDETLAYLETVTEASYEGAHDRQIVLPYFKEKYLTGADYARTYLVPNFFFHVVVAYGLARAAGVPIGKGDFTNGLPFRDLPV